MRGCVLAVCLALISQSAQAAEKKPILERIYDKCKEERRLHPKIWATTKFTVHFAIGTLQAASAVIGMKR
jgi:hypothetical protein